MKKTLLRAAAALLLLAAPALANAEDVVVKRLVLISGSGETTYFLMDDQPVMTVANGEATVNDGTTAVTFSQRGLTFRFEDYAVPTAIEGVEAGEAPSMKPGKAFFEGLKAGTPVQVFTPAGILVDTIIANGEGAAAVDYSALPKGVYILRANNTSIKVMNK